jgi:Na+-transporting NADH:ubiquinone oxidoreductase subunit B
MRAFIQGILEKNRAPFEEGGKLRWAWPLYEGMETFWLTPDHKTKEGAHVRDAMDVKRLMIFVVYALLPPMFFGMWNIGYQGYLGEGVADPAALDCLVRGALAMLPIVVMSYAAGGAAELLFCVVRGHEINEGFLVTGLIFPLTLAPTTPLWMVGMAAIFGVVIGKEVFGGVGMNILNPALTARAFVFFAYPAAISGAKVWDVAGKGSLITEAVPTVDAYTGATPLLAVAGAEPGTQAVDALTAAGWSWQDMAIGFIPGSMGEVSALACLIGALFLITTGIASWRIMVGCVVGLAVAATGMNLLAGPESAAALTLPFHYHLVMGGFAYGAIYMATDPVSASATNAGRWMYGILIGVLAALVRVVNPAYPEGMMLAILFMNVFAPLIDYYVVQRTTKRRVARMAAQGA